MIVGSLNENSLEASVTKVLCADITSIPQRKPCPQPQESQVGQQLLEHSSDARDVWVRHRKTVHARSRPMGSDLDHETNKKRSGQVLNRRSGLAIKSAGA